MNENFYNIKHSFILEEPAARGMNRKEYKRVSSYLRLLRRTVQKNGTENRREEFHSFISGLSMRSYMALRTQKLCIQSNLSNT